MPATRSFRAVLGALVAWTLFVWGTRINNALAADALAAGTKAISIAMAAALIVVALVAGVAAWRGAPIAGPLLRVFLGATAVVWAVRVPQIWLTEHPGVANPTAFNLVHTMLGVVSIGLAAAVWRLSRRTPTGPGEPARAAAGESPAPVGHR